MQGTKGKERGKTASKGEADGDESVAMLTNTGGNTKMFVHLASFGQDRTEFRRVASGLQLSIHSGKSQASRTFES